LRDTLALCDCTGSIYSIYSSFPSVPSELVDSQFATKLTSAPLLWPYHWASFLLWLWPAEDNQRCGDSFSQQFYSLLLSYGLMGWSGGVAAFLSAVIFLSFSQFWLTCCQIIYLFLTNCMHTALRPFAFVLQAAEAATVEATSRNSRGGPVWFLSYSLNALCFCASLLLPLLHL